MPVKNAGPSVKAIKETRRMFDGFVFLIKTAEAAAATKATGTIGRT